MISLKTINFFIKIQLHENSKIHEKAFAFHKKIEIIEKRLNYFYSKTMLVFAIKR